MYHFTFLLEFSSVVNTFLPRKEKKKAIVQGGRAASISEQCTE